MHAVRECACCSWVGFAVCAAQMGLLRQRGPRLGHGRARTWLGRARIRLGQATRWRLSCVCGPGGLAACASCDGGTKAVGPPATTRRACMLTKFLYQELLLPPPTLIPTPDMQLPRPLLSRPLRCHVSNSAALVVLRPSASHTPYVVTGWAAAIASIPQPHHAATPLHPSTHPSSHRYDSHMTTTDAVGQHQIRTRHRLYTSTQ